MYYSANNTIGGSVNNNADYGGGIYLYSGDNNRLINLVITNNSSGSVNSVIHLYSSISGFAISNRLIEGSGAPISIGIYEREDITGHVLMNNTFITNKLGYLYREDTSDRWTTNNSNWTNIIIQLL